MRKITTIVACVGVLIFGMVGGAGAYTQSLDLYTVLSGNDSFTWEHSTPADFEVPYDIVNGATLNITAFSANGPNGVGVEGTIVGSLSGGVFSWSDNTFNIKDIFATWVNGNKLDVTVTALDNFLYLGTSTFTLDYDNGYPPANDPPVDNAPVPEPATMLLLGSGLASLGLFGKRKKMAV